MSPSLLCWNCQFLYGTTSSLRLEQPCVCVLPFASHKCWPHPCSPAMAVTCPSSFLAHLGKSGMAGGFGLVRLMGSTESRTRISCLSLWDSICYCSAAVLFILPHAWLEVWVDGFPLQGVNMPPHMLPLDLLGSVLATKYLTPWGGQIKAVSIPVICTDGAWQWGAKGDKAQDIEKSPEVPRAAEQDLIRVRWAQLLASLPHRPGQNWCLVWGDMPPTPRYVTLL